jgi:hypothetical protein
VTEKKGTKNISDSWYTIEVHNSRGAHSKTLLPNYPAWKENLKMFT